MGFLKPKPQKSENLNRGLITSTYSPSMQQGVGATNFLSSLLTGQGDVGAAQGGLQQYMQDAGFENALKRMQQGVVGGNAAQGLLRSGATSTALLNRGAELNQGFYNNYLAQLGNLAGIGNQAGSLIANVGQRSTGGGPSTLGSIASAVGGIASIPGVGGLAKKIFSDRRLKQDASKIGELSDGLGIWAFRYIGGTKQFIGVMADEVARLRPWALGSSVNGYATVDMGAL
jgi:hypothetical protein